MTKLWIGELDSYNIVASATEKVEKLKADGMTAGRLDDMLAELPPMWRHEGSTAVVNVHGPLVQGDAGWMALFGVTGYDNLRRAALEAAQHEDTQSMLFNFETPGGDVSGIIEAAEDLAQISAMKPTAIYTGEQMCSAGYWLASSLKNAHITAGPTSVVGSIGVIKVHTETSKRMEDAGVKVTVIRAGKYKAELNSIEPITPEIHERAQSQINDVHKMFRDQVAKGRPNLAAEDLAEVTEGQVFLGQRAVKAGLADKVGSFSLALNLLDKRKQSRDTSSKSKGKTMALTPEQLKAIASGAPLKSFNLNDDGTEMSAAEIEAYAAEVRAAEAAKVAKEADDARADADAKDKANQPQAPPDAVVAMLEKQVATANAQIVQLTVAASAHAAISAAHDGLLAIARAATANMLIPMGGTAAAVEGMDAAAVIAEHARIKPVFMANFPGGRQTLPGKESANAENEKANTLPPGFMAAVKTAPSAKR